eukprot:2998103-Amphidinium_carterae.1
MRKWMSNYKVQNHLLPRSSGPSRHAPPPPPGMARQQKSEKRSAPPQASVAKRAKGSTKGSGNPMPKGLEHCTNKTSDGQLCYWFNLGRCTEE